MTSEEIRALLERTAIPLGGCVATREMLVLEQAGIFITEDVEALRDLAEEALVGREKIAALEAENEHLREDKDRLDWMFGNPTRAAFDAVREKMDAAGIK